MSAIEDTKWCYCGHSLPDHAVYPDRDPGECFVGGCGCSLFTWDLPFAGFRSGLPPSAAPWKICKTCYCEPCICEQNEQRNRRLGLMK